MEVLSIGVLVAQRRRKQLLAQFRHRRRISESVALAVEAPHSGQIMWIKRMAFDFIFCRRVRSVFLVLATRTCFPSLGGRNGRDGCRVVGAAGKLIRPLRRSRLLSATHAYGEKCRDGQNGNGQHNDSVSHSISSPQYE